MTTRWPRGCSNNGKEGDAVIDHKKGFDMKGAFLKIAVLAALLLGSLITPSTVEARPGWRGGYGGYYGPRAGYGYGYRPYYGGYNAYRPYYGGSYYPRYSYGYPGYYGGYGYGYGNPGYGYGYYPGLRAGVYVYSLAA